MFSENAVSCALFMVLADVIDAVKVFRSVVAVAENRFHVSRPVTKTKAMSLNKIRWPRWPNRWRRLR